MPLLRAALYAGPVQTIAKDHEMTKTTDTETEANRQTMTETFEAWRDGAEPFPDVLVDLGLERRATGGQRGVATDQPLAWAAAAMRSS